MAALSGDFGGSGVAAHAGKADAVAGAADVVLIVEDNDTVAGLLTHILARVRRRVVRARSGAECLALFAEHRRELGLVILDCKLPDMEGVSLCRELRKENAALPVLLTSGRDYSRDGVLDTAGATAFLPKPFRPADVELKVTTLLGAIP